ncbi:hypothetical protein SISSUDRAFT_396042 [Sistotremastrum suecicum HHB10207 ss-3]|uniref:DUF6533 domain-containing protein n=1 Tax=Sistotremastrum suecicum HHB10207 ss-3 TaxID=1314776 RepID=A0A165YUP8_9AGAM|nr:hypothetical protein SISSUDRAFT_396042 [Sistotremastrum suecicum HHB10207 ss-3]
MINGNPSDAGIALANLASTEVPAYVVVFLYTVRYKMRACALSAMVVMVHDIISTLEDEVKHFWRKGWSLHKVLYFLMRYIGFIVHIFNLYVYFNPSSVLVRYFVRSASDGRRLGQCFNIGRFK